MTPPPQPAGLRTSHAASPWLRTVILFVLALALRLWGLRHECLWLDECLTFETARQPGAAAVLAYAAANDPHPPLYFLFMHFWIALFGTSPAALRMPSVLAGAAAAPLCAAVVRRCCRAGATPWLPWLAGALFAFNPMQVCYGQEARAYAPLVMLELAAAFTLLRAFPPLAGEQSETQPTPAQTPWLLAAAALAALALWVHYFALFPLLGMALVLLPWRRGGPKTISLRPALGVAFVCAAVAAWPALGLVRGLLSGRGVGWLPAAYDATLLPNVARAQWFAPFHWPFAPWQAWLGLAAGLGLSVRGIFAARGYLRPIGARWLWAGLFSTLLLPVAVSFIKPIIFYGERYLIIAQPFTLLLLALGAAPAVRGRALAWAALAVLIGLQGAYLVEYYAYRHKPLYDLAWQQIMPTPGPATVYVTPTYHRFPVEYYAPPGARVVGVADLAEARASRGAARPAWVLLPHLNEDPRTLLQRAGITWLGPLRVLETHLPTNELTILQLGPDAPAPHP